MNRLIEEKKHIDWLMENYSNVKAIECDLTDIFENFKNHLH